MKIRYFGIVILVLALGAGHVRAAGLAVGDAVSLNWRTTNGVVVVNRELKGHLLVVDFWASWCPACMQEAPDVANAYRLFARDGVGFVGVSLDEDLAVMRQTTGKIGYVWPQVCSGLGWNDPIAQQWGINEIPDAFIIGPNSKVLWKGFPDALAAALKTQLKEHPTQTMLARQAKRLVMAATATVLAHHNVAEACRDIEGISPAIRRDPILLEPVKKLLFAVRRNGLKLAQQLHKHTKAMDRLSAMIGRRNVMMYLGL
ncbi:MAG: TlpA family protein disulfide reductase [Phycisphaerae bacterium]